MLKRAALFAVVLVTAGCGSVERAGGPEPVERHLVYEKIGLWIADVDGSRPRRLVADGSGPELSPDGKWVTYLDDSVGNLFVVSSAGGKPRLLAQGLYALPSWSPDSERIAARLSTNDDLDRALVSIDVASGEQVTLTRDSPWGWSFSPDGKRIVYAISHEPSSERFNGSKIDLFVTGRDGGDPKRITDTGDSGYPVWGPKAIAFARLIPYRGWGRHEIWQVQPDGSGRKTITGPLPERFLGSGWVGLIPIGWSDDGRALLGAWSGEFNDVPVAVDPGTGGVRVLDESHDSAAVAITHDGKFVLAQSNGEERPAEEQAVSIVPYAGGTPKVVARGAGSPSWNR